MNTENVYTYFNDENFVGVDILTQVPQVNQNSISKFLKITKDIYSAQDLYIKAITKANSNLSSLLKEKQDPFISFYEILSETFSIFTGVNRDFTVTLCHIIKTLQISFDKVSTNQIKVFNSKDLAAIDEFKLHKLNVIKSKQKLSISSNVNNGAGRMDRNTEKLKSTCLSNIEKYNSCRDKYNETLKEGASKSYAIQVLYTEMIRKYVKGFGNALAKLAFDLKEAVDHLKKFYRHNSLDIILEKWVLNTKTVDKTEEEPFPNESLDPEQFGGVKLEDENNAVLIDLSNGPESTNTDGGNKHENNKKIFHQLHRASKFFQSRKRSQPVISFNANNHNIMDMDFGGESKTGVSDTVDSTNTNDVGSNNKSTNNNYGLFKSNKKKWTPFSNLKKFQSASDLTSDVKETEECWQSRSNLNEEVKLDEDGFVIRSDQQCTNHSASIDRSSSSSSDNSEFLKKIRVKIRPVSHKNGLPSIRPAAQSELIDAASSLPQPNSNHVPSKRVSQPCVTRNVPPTGPTKLRRSSRLVSEQDRLDLYRRSMSVVDLQSFKNRLVNLDTSHDAPKQHFKKKESSEDSGSPLHQFGSSKQTIPVAFAFIERISSENIDKQLTISGQCTLAVPILLKQLSEDFFSLQSLPDLVFLIQSSDFILNDFQVPSAIEQYISIESNKDENNCQLIIKKEKLEYLFNSSSGIVQSFKSSTPTGTDRISIPILEYSTSNWTTDDFGQINLFYCIHEWLNCEESQDYIFQFQISGHWIEYATSMKVRVNLVSEGQIKNIIEVDNNDSISLNDNPNSPDSLVTKRQNDLSWLLIVHNNQQIYHVIIKNKCKTRIRVRLDYEFLLTNYSILTPTASINDDDIQSSSTSESCSGYQYKMILTHYQTISSGNVSQYFQYNLIE